MDITGYDNVIFTFQPPDAAVKSFITSVQELWPQTSVDFIEEGFHQSYKGESAASDCARAVKIRPHASLYFYCNDGLRAHHEEYGYTLDRQGLGPFAVYIRVRKTIGFKLAGVDERVSDRDSPGVSAPEPYEAWLASPFMFEVTIVTPSDDETNVFTDQVLSLALSCLRS